MNDSSPEFLTKSRLTALRKKWSEPDSSKGKTWEYDGVYEGIGSWAGYSHEMREGLGNWDCETFDELVEVLEKKLGRKPNVIDLMGGAYFLDKPENTNTLTGIRIHDKDEEYLEAFKDSDRSDAKIIKRIIKTPNRKVIEADILSNKGWRTIEEADIPKADLLVCRPMGPFDVRHATAEVWEENLTVYAGLYSSLFKRMLKLVNKEDGLIFTEAPDIYSDEEIKIFFTEADKEHGLHIDIFTASDKDYHMGGCVRRYAVIKFKNG